MEKQKVKKSIRTLAERQRAICHRPLKKEDIEELNCIFEKIDQDQEQAEQERKKKIAHGPEANA